MASIGATPGQRRGRGRGRGRTIAGIIATTLADGVSMFVAQCTVVERPLAHITTTGMVIVNATRAAIVACQKDSMRCGTSSCDEWSHTLRSSRWLEGWHSRCGCDHPGGHHDA